ncbi:MAG TPA: GAF domain-containing protein, partial [Chloroflexota bacterium]|nr:GAF domain-containing protein [Chloroflexota bacterium]
LERVAVQGQDRAAVGDISALFAHYERLAEQMISAVRAGASRDELRSREEALGQVREQILDRTQHLIDDYLTDEAAAKAEIDRFQGARLVTLLLVAVLVLIAGSVSAATAAQAVRGPAKRLVEAARAMSAGDYEPALALASPVVGTERVGEASAPTPKNELRELMLAFSRMASALERREARLAAHAGVSHALSSSIDIDQISQSALTHIVNYTRCEFGAVYVAEPFSPSMRCVASYALDDTLEKVTPGQGLLGQAAKDRRTIVVRDIPVDSPFRLRFGVDSLPPRTLVATPLVFEQQLTGLVVLGSIRALDGDAVEFVEQTGQQFAISLRNALSHAAVTRLAVELDEKNEELQAQNEEIQAQNEEIQAQNEELQAQGEELQAQNEELETQRLQLLEADRQKDEFLSVASHELKSPITSLKGFVQLLRRRIRSRPELGDFDSTVANLERQTEIVVTRIERMLDASRAKMGRLQPKLGAVDLKELVRAQILQAQAKTGAHQIEGHFPSGSVVAQVDQGYIEQAVGNLLDNAIRYSPD